MDDEENTSDGSLEQKPADEVVSTAETEATPESLSEMQQEPRVSSEEPASMGIDKVFEQKGAESKLLKIALTDELTGLYNRRYLRTRFVGYLESFKEKGGEISLMIVDLDRFKNVNDTYGHLAGDQLLKAFAYVLKKISKGKAIPVRYAGDEFLLILPNRSKKFAKFLGEKMLEILSRNPVKLSDQVAVKIGASIGIASFPHNANNYTELVKRADDALYQAKSEGGGKVVLYPDTGEIITKERLASLFPPKEMVGREKEIAYLTDYILSELDECPILVGDPGIGKSFLLKWAERRAMQEGIQVIYATCQSWWKVQPLAVLFSAISSYRSLFPSRFDELIKDLPNDVQSVILDRLMIKPSPQDYTPEDVLSALSALLFKITSVGKTFLIIDDLQKIDQDSLRFINSFMSQFREAPFYLLFAFESRTSGAPELLEVIAFLPQVEARLDIVTLSPFSREDVRAYVHQIFKQDILSDDLLEHLYRGSQGVPLYVQSILEYLVMEGKLYHDGSNWQVADIKAVDMEMSFELMVQRKLASLDPETMDVVMKASLLGESFDINELAELIGKSEQELLKVLRKAEEAYIIRESNGQEGDFAFTSDIQKDAIYHSIGEKDRERLNRDVVEMEQRLYSNHMDRFIGRLLIHFNQASMWRQAAQLMREEVSSYIGAQISESALKRLQKAATRHTLAQEIPLSDDDLKRMVITLRNFKIALQNLRLYPRENENVKMSIGKVFNDFSYFFTKTEALTMSVTQEVILINGQEPPKENLGGLVDDYYKLMVSVGLQGMMFVRGLTVDELVSFMEIIIEKPPDLQERWDELLDEKEISHIFPDRKVYVAVGERRIVMEQQDKIVVGGSSSKSEDAAGGGVSSAQLEQVQQMLRDFHKESGELMNMLKSGDVESDKLDRLSEILEKLAGGAPKASPTTSSTDSELAEDGEASNEPPIPIPLAKYSTEDGESIIKANEEDVKTALENLTTSDRKLLAESIKTILSTEEEASRLLFDYITLERPAAANRLAAHIVKKMGGTAEIAFLEFISPTLPENKLLALIDILDIFQDNPHLYQKVRELFPIATPSVLEAIEKLLMKSPSNLAEKAIMELMEIGGTNTKVHLLRIAGERKMRGIFPIVQSWFSDSHSVKTLSPMILETALSVLGDIGDPQSVPLLLNIVKPPSIFSIRKAMPPRVRLAALMALRKFKPPELERFLKKLSKDREPRIATLAKTIIENN